MSGTLDQRLYYADPYLVRFEARVMERLSWQGHPAIILDHTAFYPTSGGQPSDRGTLSGIPVTGVEVREVDGAVVHLLAGDLTADQVVGEVDWERRFDHMQQHSGQHLLSAACERLLHADTVAFHLGAAACTIDLNVARLTLETMAPVEDLVNRVIWEDRPVTARFVERAELAKLALRRPPQVKGPLRLVEVGPAADGPPFDLNPCGGTHVTHTGEIGLLKVVRLEQRGAETRVEFLCGGRALRDYCAKNRTVHAIANMLTVGQGELEEAIARLQAELKTAQRGLRAFKKQALELEAARLAQVAVPAGPFRLVRVVLEGRDPADLRALAARLVAQSSVVAVLLSRSERTHVCVARSEDVGVDAVELLRAICEPLGGKGGGRPQFAQGSGPAVPLARAEQLLAAAVADLDRKVR